MIDRSGEISPGRLPEMGLDRFHLTEKGKRMKSKIIGSLVVLCLWFAFRATGQDTIWPRQTIVPLPDAVDGMAEPVICLNGIWKFTRTPPERFWQDNVSIADWPDIAVPGECVMQGFDIEQNVEFAYKTEFTVPRDFAGRHIILRFDRVYSYTRVWVDGLFVRDHQGGFTTWDCDITDLIKTGKKVQLTVGVTDVSPEVSWGSGYAKHNIGGILGDVLLIAAPKTFITSLHVDTDLDEEYTHAILKVTASIDFHRNEDAEIHLKLSDPMNRSVVIEPDVIKSDARAPRQAVSIPVNDVTTWDAEHPHRYELQADLLVGNRLVQTVSLKFGFREVERRGTDLLVNGRPVKLYGVNRHNVHPLLGRAVTAEFDELDARLFKEANVNFVRTSHYPPTRTFLDACDRYGIYVEEETAVCFVNTWGNALNIDDGSLLPRFMNQFAEMIERDRDHPCVIMWSLGNENRWNDFFLKQLEYVRAEDTGRPVIFSYPATIPDGLSAFDIFSHHYPDFSDNLSEINFMFPVLHDEYAHIPCYDTDELRNDPNVRNFWGESIKRFGDDLFSTDGALGAAIWCGIDEVFQIPLDEHVKPINSNDFDPHGYGEWGIIDGWRRKKPEFWHVKKAYSPIKMTEDPIALPDSMAQIRLPVINRFCHTDLSELDITWEVGEQKGEISDVHLEPNGRGILVIPHQGCHNGDTLTVAFYRDGHLVDLYKLPVFFALQFYTRDMRNYEYDRALKHFAEPSGTVPVIGEDENHIVISGEDFELVFSQKSGLIERGTYRGKTVIEGGPYFHIFKADLADWTPQRIEVQRNENFVLVKSAGNYGDVSVCFDISIFGNGTINTVCHVLNPPIPPNRNDQNSGAGFGEVGISYILSSQIDRLSWDRKGIWSVYPADHIGRRTGTAVRIRPKGDEEYGEKPTWQWSQDMNNFFLNGRNDEGFGATNDFRSMKENIWFASALLAESEIRLRVESRGQHAVRLAPLGPEPDSQVKLVINSRWSYPDLRWGNFTGVPIWIVPGESFSARMRLTDHDRYLEE